ncbi:zinc finger BED domain-containing protein RICESLEEPER 2-like protein [Tanacetum coccineum]
MRYADETEDMELEVAESQSKLAYANDIQNVEMEAADSPANLNSKGAKHKEYKERSCVWIHFIKYFDNNDKPRAKCNYCGTVYSGDTKSGTSTLWGHLNKCESNSTKPPTDQTHLAFNTTRVVETGEMKHTLQAWKFDQQKCRNVIAEMIIIVELPLKFVKNEGFRRCMKMCQPALVVPSRSTITRDCYQLWKLQNKIINLCPISNHQGNDIGRAIESCLLEWALPNILTITVDNASSNDTAVDYLKTKLVKWNDRCILQGKWTHVRCMAHIMNLVVQDGLKDVGISVDRVRVAVRWVRQSPARLKRFKEFAIMDNIVCQKSLCLDVPTRWNSTYLMLSVAIEYEKVFDRFSEEDYVFMRDLGEGPGVPTSNDWANVRRLVGFLQHFYLLTLKVSGTKYITSNTYLDAISCIDSVLKECLASEDNDLKKMAMKMKLKFDKYWGDIKKFNLLVFIASVFDPRTKMEYLQVTLNGMYGDDEGPKVAELCEKALIALFNDYKRIYSNQNVRSVSSSSFDDATQSFSISQSVTDRDSKSELDRYLIEEIEGDDAYFKSGDFTVLGWWKSRSPAFPVLSLVARDILAIPISTVASESTFSTGGRVLDSFRSSLSLETVQALICCQDWVRSGDVAVNLEENIDDLEKFEDEMGTTSNASNGEDE